MGPRHCVKDDGATGLLFIGYVFSVESHIPVPFPGLPVVGGERLRPNGSVGLTRIPAELHDDVFLFVSVPRIEAADSVFKRADLWNVQYDCLAVCPIDI